MTELSLNRRQLDTMRRQKKEHGVIDLVGTTYMKPRRFRRQKGQLLEYKDGWVLRYNKYNEVTGKHDRIVESLHVPAGTEHKLDAIYAQRRRMKEINADVRRVVEVAQGEMDIEDITVGTFADTEWLRYIYQPEADIRRITAESYEEVFDNYIREAIGNRSLKNFRPADGDEFLKALRGRGYRRAMISRIKSVCSGLFARAVACKRIEMNPWREVHVKVSKGRREKREYTVEERDAILNLKTLSLKAKAFFALVSVTGLRPGEAGGMKWENIDFKNEVMHVKEAVDLKGRLGLLKTEGSKRTLAITEPLLSHLKRYHKEQKQPSVGLLFTRERGPNRGAPIRTTIFADNHIKRYVPEHMAYKAIYAGRHLSHKAIWDATHDVLLVTKFTGNTPVVAMNEYLRASTAEAIQAQRLVEARQTRASKRKR